VAAQPSAPLIDEINDKSSSIISTAVKEMSSSMQQDTVAKKFSLITDRSRQLKQTSPANMIQHDVKRKKKTPEQVAYLQELFQRLNGEWDGKVRKEAMRKTGLSRIQIYKWFFDMKLQQLPKQQKVKPEERVSYPPSIIQPVCLEDLDL
jgi:predicted DNA-binding transcriptional regulator AlpA